MAWLETHKLHLVYAGAAALAVWLAAFTYSHVRAGQEAAANAALAALSKPADRTGKQVQPPASDYLKVAEQHAGTRAGERALLFAADRLFTEGKYPEAKARFEKYLAANATGPAAAVALLGIAACQEAAGEVDKSIATHQQVLAEHGSSPEAHPARLALGLLHELKNQPDQALRLYDEVLRAKPVSVWRMEAEMRREQLLRRHPQLALGTPSAAPALPAVVAPATNAPPK
ncbi:MAG: tetratricopeptide repeat protein [Verrucomicrobia bacterium]|nr:tetratricopeptide repeat protein [Verrucomicrobiota bacterium]